MSESELHRNLKGRVSSELQTQGYIVFHEPCYSIFPSIDWSAYRPDLLGAKRTSDGDDFVFVECETIPSTKKLSLKSSKYLWLQTHLARRDTLRRIAAIPPGTLRRLDLRVRRDWEIWIVKDTVSRIPRTSEASVS